MKLVLLSIISNCCYCHFIKAISHFGLCITVIFVPLFGFVLYLRRTPLTSGKITCITFSLFLCLAYYREIMTKHFQSILFIQVVDKKCRELNLNLRCPHGFKERVDASLGFFIHNSRKN